MTMTTFHMLNILMYLAGTIGEQTSDIIQSLEPFGFPGLSQVVLLVMVLIFVRHLQTRAKQERIRDEEISQRFESTHKGYLEAIERISKSHDESLDENTRALTKVSLALQRVSDSALRAEKLMQRVHDSSLKFFANHFTDQGGDSSN